MAINWQTIIELVITLIGGGLIGRFFRLKADTRKAGAEADNTAIDGLNSTIQQLASQLADRDADLKERDARIELLTEQLTHKTNECTTKGYYLCVHHGCKLRRPSLGRGDQYFLKHREDEQFGADFSTVEELLANFNKQATN